MPLMRYFVFVGGILIALLLISDAVLPKQPLPSYMNVTSSEQPAVRIRSDRKWPERIVFDTSAPTMPPMMAESMPAPRAGVDAMTVKAGVRDAFAQVTPPAVSSRAKTEANIDAKAETKTDQAVTRAAETRPQPKRKIARARPSRPLLLVAQQPHFGLMDSTW